MRWMAIVVMFYALSSFSQHPHYYTLNADNQLPSNQVYYLFQDRQSFIWLGTSAGLYRFDGKEFKLYSNRLQSSREITNIQQSNDDKLWCQNFTGQIFYVQKDSLFLAADKSLAQSNIPQFTFASDGTFYLTVDSGIIRYKDSKKNLLRLPTVNKINSTRFITDLLLAENKLYVAESYVIGHFRNDLFTPITNTNRIDKLQDVYRQPFLYLIKNKIYLLAHGERQNSIWQIRNDSLIWIRDLPRILQRVYALHADAKGHIWVGSSNGVLCMDEEMKDLYNGKIFFPGKNISDVMADEEGNYWFGSLNEGIFVVPSLDVWVMDEDNSALPDRRIKKLATDASGNLFIGMQNGMLSKWNTINQSIKTISFPFSPYEIQTLYYESTRQKLLVGQNKFWSVDARTLESQIIPIIENVKALTTTTPPNAVFIGTVNYAAKADWKLLPTLKQTLRYKRVRCVTYHPVEQKLFVGYADGLYVYYNKNEKELTYNGERIYANDLAICENGNLYIATKAGVLQWENSEVRKVHDFPAEYIAKLHADKNTLWCAAQDRLLKYDTKTKYVTEYNRLDGLASTEISDIKTIGPTIYLATPKGVISFPQNLNPYNTTGPKVFITRFAIHEKDTTLFSNYTLPYVRNNITIHFNAAPYRAQGNHTFKYRLQGLDTAWITCNSNSNFARFPSLPAGKYLFEVKALNEDGIESSQTAQVQIEILKPYWQRWWFFVLCGLLLSGIVSGLFALRIRSIRKKAALEKRMANSQLTALKSRMNPHFMFNALNSIQDLVLQHETDNAQLYLGKFSELTRKVLDVSGTEFISLQEEIEMLQLYLDLEKLRFGNELNCSINIDDQLDTEHVKIPSMIIQPFVENAFQHGLLHKAGEKKLEISFINAKNSLLCTIQDNGVGRKASADINLRRRKHKSFATNAVAERFRLLNDFYHVNITWHITDEADGTKVEIQIPEIPLHE